MPHSPEQFGESKEEKLKNFNELSEKDREEVKSWREVGLPETQKRLRQFFEETKAHELVDKSPAPASIYKWGSELSTIQVEEAGPLFEKMRQLHEKFVEIRKLKSEIENEFDKTYGNIDKYIGE